MRRLLVVVLLSLCFCSLLVGQSALAEMTAEQTPLEGVAESIEDVATPVEREETIKSIGVEGKEAPTATAVEDVNTIKATEIERKDTLKSKSVEEMGTIKPKSIK